MTLKKSIIKYRADILVSVQHFHSLPRKCMAAKAQSHLRAGPMEANVLWWFRLKDKPHR